MHHNGSTTKIFTNSQKPRKHKPTRVYVHACVCVANGISPPKCIDVVIKEIISREIIYLAEYFE